jgi:hypothetical protein
VPADAPASPRRRSSKDRKRAVTELTLVPDKIGEGSDNLRARASAFNRRRRSST